MKQFILLQYSFVVFFMVSPTRNCSGTSTSSLTLVYSLCSDVKYSPSSPYHNNLDSLLTSLTNAASFTPYSNFTTFIYSPLYPVSGLYQCRADLSISDCDSCVRYAAGQHDALCSASSSATLQFRGCLLQYSNDTSFVGKPDTRLQFKRCGPGMIAGAYDPNLMATRDEVLTALSAEQGYNRVSQAGSVSGSGQCVGDQDANSCKDCVTEAVADLRNYCGGAVSGEVYLGKCYAEYSAQGIHYDYSNGNNNNDNDNDNKGNNAGKDLAIIIGIVAALILIIFFISHVNKSSGDKGNA